METRHTTPNPWRRRTQNGVGTFYPPVPPRVYKANRIRTPRRPPSPPPSPPPRDPYRRLLDDLLDYRQLVEDPPLSVAEQAHSDSTNAFNKDIKRVSKKLGKHKKAMAQERQTKEHQDITGLTRQAQYISWRQEAIAQLQAQLQALKFTIGILEKKNVKEQHNWAEIPTDALAIIFHKLGEPYARIFAGPVCRSWWRLAIHPAGPYLRCVQGRCIDMRRLPESLWLVSDTDKLCKAAFDHTAGQIDKLYAVNVSNDLLRQIADKVSNLRFLSLINSPKLSFTCLHDFLLRHCPLLEELRLYACLFNTPKNGQLGQACPELKSFWVDGTYTSDDEINEEPEYRRFKKSKRDHGYYGFFRSDSSDVESDDYPDTDSDSDDLLSQGDRLAYEIASNMPNLRRLQLVRCRTLTRKGVHAILNKCLHLESLDLRCCFSLRVNNALHNKLSKIKSVRLSRASRFRPPN